MGGLLLVFLLRSCLLSAVDGTLTFCSQHGSLGNKDRGATLTETAKNSVVNVLCPGCLRVLHSQPPGRTRRRAVSPRLKVELFRSQGYNSTIVAMKVSKVCAGMCDTPGEKAAGTTVFLQQCARRSFWLYVSEHKRSLEPAWAIFSGLGSSSHSCSVSGVRQTPCFDSEKEARKCMWGTKRCWTRYTVSPSESVSL